MSLADDIQNAIDQNDLGVFRNLMKSMNKQDLEDFINAVNNKDVPAVPITKALELRGYTLDPKRINEYRRAMNRVKYGTDGKRVT